MGLLRLLAALLTLTFLSGTLPAQTAKKAPPKAAEKASGNAAEKASGKAPDAKAGAVVDINRAAAAELKTIPGVGDAYSAAIIKGRPYANKTQLKTRGIIPGALYEKIKDQIIAKQ
jgi:DNA uptake protein ComE-like DNA-binding protein